MVPAFLSCGITTQFSKEQLPRKSYLFVKKILKLKKCQKTSCSSDTYISVGSGFVIKKTALGSFALTAAHVCENGVEETEELKVSGTIKVQTLDGRYYKAEILSKDREIDVCLLFVEDLVEGIEEVTILIGLLHSVFIGMNQIVVSVNYEALKQFIKRNMINIYPQRKRKYEEETFLRYYQKISAEAK